MMARKMIDGEALALAQPGCTTCLGLGYRWGRGDQKPTCNCVWRSIFRACLARFKQLYHAEGHVSQVKAGRFDQTGRAHFKPGTPILPADYLADFLIVARRALEDRPLSQQIFKFHVLLGADWRLCTRKLAISRGEFFHEVYRVQQIVGKAFYETEPFALFPLDEYFGGTVRGARSTKSLMGYRRIAEAYEPLRAPLNQCVAMASGLTERW